MATIFLDMDGTLCDLYNVPNWLEKLRNNETTPYRDAEPLCDCAELAELIHALYVNYDIKVKVLTWGSKDADNRFNGRTKVVKKNWLRKHGLGILADDGVFKFLPYGKDKSMYASFWPSPSNVKYTFLIDDDASIRNDWNNVSADTAFDPTSIGIYKTIFNLAADIVEGNICVG